MSRMSPDPAFAVRLMCLIRTAAACPSHLFDGIGETDVRPQDHVRYWHDCDLRTHSGLGTAQPVDRE